MVNTSDAFEVLYEWTRQFDDAQANGEPLPTPPVDAVRDVLHALSVLRGANQVVMCWLHNSVTVPPRGVMLELDNAQAVLERLKR